MKKASELTQTVINNNIALVLDELPENWHLKLVLLYYKDVEKMSWNRIFIKIGCVDDRGIPDSKKGERYKSIYKRIKDKSLNQNILDEDNKNCKAMV